MHDVADLAFVKMSGQTMLTEPGMVLEAALDIGRILQARKL